MVSASDLERDAVSHFTNLEYQKAKECWGKAAAIRKSVSPNSLDLAMTFSKLGYVHLKENQVDDAQRYHAKALAICERQPTNSVDWTAENHEVIAAIIASVNLMDKTLPICEKAGLATLYYRLGIVLQKQNRLDEVMPLLIKAESIEKERVPDSLELAIMHCNVGESLKAAKRFDDARFHQYKAININKDNDLDEIRLAAMYVSLGDAFRDDTSLADNLVKAWQKYDKAMSIQEKRAPQSTALANTYHKAADTFLCQNQLGKALQYYEKEIAIQEHHAPDSLELVATYCKHGNVCKK